MQLIKTYRFILLLIYRITGFIFTRTGILKFQSIKKLYSLIILKLKSKLISDVVVLDGHKIFLDSVDSLFLSIDGEYQVFEKEIMEKEIESGDTVLDIGANIGYFTMIFADLVGACGKVFAFEPDPDNFALLKRNIEENGYKNVELIQKAALNRTGMHKLYLCEDNRADHRVYDSHDGRSWIEIHAVELDDYFKNYDGKIDFIKIDVQGAEGSVIEGMLDLLDMNKDIKIVTEFWPFGLKRSGFDPAEFLKLVIKSHFDLFELDSQKNKVEAVKIEDLLRKYSVENQKFTDLLCIKYE